MIDTGRLREHLMHRLTPERYHHSICVRKQAIRLAAIHGVDWYRAEVAGLLHDIGHGDPPGVQLAYLRSNGVKIDELLSHPPLWHAISGSIYIQKELGVTDVQIIRAVRYHTTGRAGMSELEQVVYLADMTSEDRRFPGLEELRAASRYSLDEGMCMALQHTMLKLAASKKTIVKDAFEAYNDSVQRTQL